MGFVKEPVNFENCIQSLQLKSLTFIKDDGKQIKETKLVIYFATYSLCHHSVVEESS